MNRHERRERQIEDTKLYHYISQLPEVPVDAPMERGRVYHTVFHHDIWCKLYDGGACNCHVEVTRHVEP